MNNMYGLVIFLDDMLDKRVHGIYVLAHKFFTVCVRARVHACVRVCVSTSQ